MSEGSFRLAEHERRALAGCNDLIMLVERTVDENDDTIIRAALAEADVGYFGFHAKRIAVKDGFGKPDLIPAEIADSGAEGRVAHG